MRVWPGRPAPLGATWDGNGVNFAIFSEHAEKIELCLFDSAGDQKETHRIPLPEQTDFVWHGYLPDCRPGQLYGYRVHGPYEPTIGHRFNGHKVVLDPYAKAIGRELAWSESMFTYKLGGPEEDLGRDDHDNAAHAPLAAVIDNAFRWGKDKPPRTPWHQTLIYETHVKGFSRLNPWVPSELRGTYAGLTTEGALRHFKELGVTAIELMPVHHFIDDHFLATAGRRNYWGYNTLAFLAPALRYASDQSPQGAVNEFKRMVQTLHKHGLEVILDVVYNHTAEGNHMGPHLSLRGIDNLSYYRTVSENRRYYMDYTGCGNTLNMVTPRVLQLIMDSLRYWVQEMHVDGFRFDLASALARELYDVDKLGAFFDIIHQDPVLCQVKLIAEPWDVGPGGYQVGNFPVGWTEWNGKYRDCVRKFWRGDGGMMGEMATRLTGSSDLYAHSGRRPYASVNFITCHDGFTLKDFVSYERKHNEANGEENRDGANDNYSFNCGVEGPTQDVNVQRLRARQRRNLFATLMFSQGVPMIYAGDEIGRTQQGNNNAYCHDSPFNWIDWTQQDSEKDWFDFVRKVIRIRKEQPALRRRRFFLGKTVRSKEVKDVYWLNPRGLEITGDEWGAPKFSAFGLLIRGDLDEVDEKGERIRGDNLLLLFNPSNDAAPFAYPSESPTGASMDLLLDTARPHAVQLSFDATHPYPLESHSLALFRWQQSHQDFF